MNDMSAVIVPKSDQINADDLVGGPMTVVIDAVRITPGTEQPVTIKLRGEDRFWRPCKTVSRLLVAAWGPDASKYSGRAATLYRDPKVKWGGMEVGGIRVSHLSHIDEPMRVALQETKGKRALTVVRPLQAPPSEPSAPAGGNDDPDFDARAATVGLIGDMSTAKDKTELGRVWNNSKPIRARIKRADEAAYAQLTEALRFSTEKLEAAASRGTGDDDLDDDMPV